MTRLTKLSEATGERSYLLGARSVLLSMAMLVLLGGCTDSSPSVLTQPAVRGELAHTVTAAGEIVSAQATRLSLQPGNIHTIDWVVEDGTEVKAGDVVARLNGEIAEFQFNTNKLNVASESSRGVADSSDYAKRDIEIGYDLQVVEDEVALIETFSSDLDTVYSRIEQIDNGRNLAYTQARGSYLEWDRDSNGERRSSKERLTQIQVERFERDVNRFQALLADTEILAPHDGVVKLLRSSRSGEPVTSGSVEWGGTAIAEMPDLSQLEGEVHVLAGDSAGIVVGTPVSLRLDAYPDVQLAAKVTSIAQLAAERENRRGKWFSIKVGFDEIPAAIAGRINLSFQATFMIANVSDALQIPLTALTREQGVSVAYVNNNGTRERRELELGLRTLSRVQVLSGLNEGDEVIILP
ncbi:efflux RND transporter periplasmic adaptor subunit [Umboniibacter marinipuniceus]|uniref:Multidrug efflux pump subunit AcrA (Membrane-fusion protein) n=1 Tax=Umboniibacter marinipuniceus TaxID=569599 RepID=A0A3M0AMI3_9GAMM|nr:HlyD family efflux transporter periplasmic adaptor subunit [Umboniibacter marinipuniceus]RMA80182.1 multidrug efflux pump subunit AcrA (membrane-fusion protein) [Umboniibacter marinipuniceus]